MDNFKEPSRRQQQKAIDGILFGSKEPVSRRLPGVQRRRFRAVNQPSKPQAAATPRPTSSPKAALTRLATNYDDFFADGAVPRTLDLPDSHTSSRRKRPRNGQKKQRFAFLKHPIKTFRSWSWKKRLLWIAIILIVIGALLMALLFFKGYFSAKKVFKGGAQATAIEEKQGRINILLLGNGGQGHEAPDLTDTILVASIDPINKKTALISVPRDLWVSVPGHGSMKINAAYETGKYEFLGRQDMSNQNFEAVTTGFKAADAVVEEVLGVPIHYHALIDFTAFKQAVDTVGGITVEVPETLSDPMFARENKGSSIIARAGTQQFDGKQALMYVRSRYTSSDFARSQRQRAVIIALQQKVFSLGTLSNPTKIAQLMDAFGNNAVTDLNLQNMSDLYDLTKDITPENIESVGLTDEPNVLLRTGQVGNQSVVMPVAGVGVYDAIHALVRSKTRDGNLIKENASVVVYNGTPEVGKAKTVADALMAEGYAVTTVADAPSQEYQNTQIIDRTGGKKPYTAKGLLKHLKVQKTTAKLPDSAIQSQNADFVIILGGR